MKGIRFFVPGIPAPGGSKRGFAIKKGGAYTGHVAIVDAGGERTKNWRASVVSAAWKAMEGPSKILLLGPIQLELLFQMPRPKSHFRSDGVTLRPSAPLHHVIRPDCGKLARSTTDACTGILWRDDAQIVVDHGEKAFSLQPGCWIVVKTVEISSVHDGPKSADASGSPKTTNL